MHIKTALALSIALAANAVLLEMNQKDGKKAPGGGVAKLSKSAAATGATTATATATAAVAVAAAAAGQALARLSTDDAPSVEGLTGDLTVSSISSYVGLGQKQGCIRTEDKSKFCLRTQYEEVKDKLEQQSSLQSIMTLIFMDPTHTTTLVPKRLFQAKEKAGTTADKPKDKSGTVVGNTFTAALAASAIIAIMFQFA
ncbi:hypothetical protein BSLG_006044 [Batrachochytrium salamandrivorans]|nr:hypothetical protein BSLG_006044 [Batrachochytrium salamandrivorans]